MECDLYFKDQALEFPICWVAFGSGDKLSLFGMADYLGALALLLVIYSISDLQSKFRLLLINFNLYKSAFWLFAVVGLLKLTMELWMFNGFSVPEWLNKPAALDIFLMIPCLLLIYLWIYFSYVSPPKFSRRNSEKYFHTFQNTFSNGTSEEIRTALKELNGSIHHIIEISELGAQEISRNRKTQSTSEKSLIDYSHFAANMLMLLGNPRICKEIMQSSPSTAGIVFDETAEQKAYFAPMEIFSRNIGVCFLSDTSSPIYAEESYWDSGWSGGVKPFSSAIFGDVELVSTLARRHMSPFDIDYASQRNWMGVNWSTYQRLALLLMENAIKDRKLQMLEQVVARILESSADSTGQLYQLNGRESMSDMPAYENLRFFSRFVRDMIDLLDKNQTPIIDGIKAERRFSQSIQESIAEAIFKTIYNAAQVRTPFWTSWNVQHNSLWADIFTFQGGKNHRWIAARVRRLIFNEVIEMDKYVNHVGASYVGYVLSVCGISDKRHDGHREGEQALRLAILSWVRRNYSRIYHKNRPVADACLHGRITFDHEASEIVYTRIDEMTNVSKERRFAVNQYAEPKPPQTPPVSA